MGFWILVLFIIMIELFKCIFVGDLGIFFFLVLNIFFMNVIRFLGLMVNMCGVMVLNGDFW